MGQIVRGSVRAVREMSGKDGPRVQAQVCLGSSTVHGSAVIMVETKSPAVLDALAVLKQALADDALGLTRTILKDQLVHDNERAMRESQSGVPR